MRISDLSSDVCSSDLSGLERPPVKPVAILRRNACIIFLLAALHFGEKGVDQRLVWCHRRFEIGVFGLQIAKHRGIFDLRIAGIAQPCVIVRDGDAVAGEAVRKGLDDGGLRSEERRVGKECVSPYRSWGSPSL